MSTNTKALTPIDTVRQTLEAMSKDFKTALPAQVTPEKFIRVVVTALRLNPGLLDLDRQSLYASCMRAAQDGLLPDGREAALVPFKGKVQYMPMVGGICKKVRNSGELSTIDSQVVHEGDEYEAWIDEKGQHFKHRKARENRGTPILTYAYAITKDGGFFFEEIDMEQMSAIEAASRAKEGPWSGPFREEMMRKSAIRRLAKYRLPSSTDLDEVIRRDDDMYDLEGKTEEELKPEPKTTPTRLGKIIEAQATEESPSSTEEVPI